MGLAGARGQARCAGVPRGAAYAYDASIAPEVDHHEFAHIIFPERAQEALLFKMGVLRQRADEVQFLCADKPLRDSTMALLLDYARRFHDIDEARNFQIFLGGETPLVLKLRGV